MTTATATRIPTGVPIFARRIRIDATQVRSVPGGDLQPGDVLVTGVILEVTRNDIDEEVRLEMPGADVHFAAYDEPVTVLATLDRSVLDAISLGTFIARAETHRTPTAHPAPTSSTRPATPRRHVTRASPPTRTGQTSPPPDQPTTSVASRRDGKANAGRLGDYDDSVEHYTDTCPIHGATTFARHKTGKSSSGRQRYARRCLICHSDYNLDHLPRQP